MNKIAIIGFSDTNKNYAYSLINQNVNIDEILFIDWKQENINNVFLNFNASFFESNIKFRVGSFKLLKEASLLVITGNVDIDSISLIVDAAKENEFSGIYVLATDNVNVDCYNTFKLSLVPSHKVIGIGTMLETSYLNYIISDRLGINKKNINSYVLGDKSNYVIPFGICNIGVMSLEDCFNSDSLLSIENEFKNDFSSNPYSLALSLVYLTDVIINNKCEILTVSSYDIETGVYISMPSIVDINGVREVIGLDLSDSDVAKMYDATLSIKKQIC